jgi:hypothetical protein
MRQIRTRFVARESRNGFFRQISSTSTRCASLGKSKARDAATITASLLKPGE